MLEITAFMPQPTESFLLAGVLAAPKQAKKRRKLVITPSMRRPVGASGFFQCSSHRTVFATELATAATLPSALSMTDSIERNDSTVNARQVTALQICPL